MKTFFAYSIGAIIGLTLGIFMKDTPAPVIEYVPYEVTDSSTLKELVLTKELLRKTQDSLNAYKSDTTISEELFVAKYKLERIRYYNDIAAKSNNIKFLRGWINRVLNE